MAVEIILSLLTLVLLEIVLGIDNIVFLSILSGKLPHEQQKKARRWGLILAMFLRLGLLSVITVIMQLKNELFTLFGHGFSGKDLILIGGGLFLLFKSTSEIYHKMEGEHGDISSNIRKITFANILIQILIMDMVFSLDSIITAVGMARHLWVMFAAVIISVGIMLFAAEPISKFVNTHPAFKMLALAFLLLIGFSLMSEGFGIEIPKGYIYFSMAFSLLVDVLQMQMNKKDLPPVETREHYTEK
ncbi:MAG: TerC family protein [Lentimicrobiaceae bacterium]|nr:TerC family protein [Lentimicrobiaceae bacterium]MCO5267182.1 TerC family protein [Lentimicrobium sp.]